MFYFQSLPLCTEVRKKRTLHTVTTDIQTKENNASVAKTTCLAKLLTPSDPRPLSWSVDDFRNIGVFSCACFNRGTGNGRTVIISSTESESVSLLSDMLFIATHSAWPPLTTDVILSNQCRARSKDAELQLAQDGGGCSESKP